MSHLLIKTEINGSLVFDSDKAELFINKCLSDIPPISTSYWYIISYRFKCFWRISKFSNIGFTFCQKLRTSPFMLNSLLINILSINTALPCIFNNNISMDIKLAAIHQEVKLFYKRFHNCIIPSPNRHSIKYLSASKIPGNTPRYLQRKWYRDLLIYLLDAWQIKILNRECH